MININLNNAEEILFLNNSIRETLSDFKQIFQQWEFAKTHYFLRNIAKKSISDLLQSLSAEDIAKISLVLGDQVTIDNLDYHIVKNISLPLDCQKELNNLGGLFDNFSISRDKEQVYISFWR